jgi:MFS family permease
LPVAADLWWANAGRLLIGASVAVAFVSMLKLATHWFAPRQFALASGLALLFGVVGGVIAGVPLRLLIEAWGWRPVMGASAAVTALLAVAIWLRVRDDPKTSATSAMRRRSHRQDPCFDPARDGRGALLPKHLDSADHADRHCRRGPHLRRPVGRTLSAQVHGLDTKAAAAITSLLLIAWAVGGPVLGALSERMGRRRPLYVATTAAALAGWAVIIFLPYPSG